MSEENLTDHDNLTEPEYQHEQLSNTEAMTGVLIAPGETYETIVTTPKKNYWLLPVMIFVVINLISTFLFISDTELLNKTMDKQKAVMLEQFSKDVKEGNMTQEQSEKAMESMNPSGILFKIITFGGAVIGPFIMLLLLGVVYLIGLKVLKAHVDFTNILNVVGLALIIVAVGNLLSVVISILRGDLSSIGLGLLMSEESVGKKVYALVSKLDIFSIWFYAVVSIGLSKTGRIDFSKSATLVFGVYIIYVMLTAFLF